MMAGQAFTGGEGVLRALETIARGTQDNPVLRVGFLEDKQEDDGTPVAQVAFWNEFGARIGK